MWAVRTTVYAGFYLLPTSESFFDRVGETLESATAPAKIFTSRARELVKAIETLYDEPIGRD